MRAPDANLTLLASVQIISCVVRPGRAAGETKTHHGRIFHADRLTPDVLREPVNFADRIVQQMLNHVEIMNPMINQLAAAGTFGIGEP